MDLTKIKKFIFETSNYCNLHCPQCPRFDAKGYLDKDISLKHLSFTNIQKNFNLDAMPALTDIMFEGDYGDPMMNPQICEFVEFFKDITVTIVTNGSIRNPSFYKQLAEYDNVRITFSIDGLEDTNHIYRINANWNKIISNVKAYTDAGGKAKWKYLIFEHNQHQVSEARKLATNLGCEFKAKYTNRNFWQDNVWPVYIDGKYQYDLTMANDTNSLSLNTKTHDIAKLHMDPDTFKSPSCHGWMDIGELYVNCYGHLLPCCMTAGVTWKNTISDQLFRKYIIGNIDDINLNLHNITEIAATDFYTHRLYESWKSVKTCHNICFANCSKTLNSNVEQAR